MATFASGIKKASDIQDDQQNNIYYGTYWQNGNGSALSSYAKTAVKYLLRWQKYKKCGMIDNSTAA